MAHRVCQSRDHLPVDKSCTHCQSLGPRQQVFQGPNTLKEFVDWLLQSECKEKSRVSQLVHERAIVIAHNFKGYNGQFILNYIVHKACIKSSVIMIGSKTLQELKKGISHMFSTRSRTRITWESIHRPLTTSQTT